jgi:protein TonB
MFEDALMESAGKPRTQRGWSSGLAAICNGTIVSLLLLWPLLHPASLPRGTISMLLAVPAPPAAPVPRMPRAVSVVAHPETLANPFAAPARIPAHIAEVQSVSPAVADNFPNVLTQQGTGLPSGLADSIGTAAPPQVHAGRPPKLAISSGVMAGNKLSGAPPQYPGIARVAGVQGTVVLGATISRSGTIENLHVISGPPMLIAAAEQAVRTWRYRSYLLNGEPVAVETTVYVVFRLGS